MATLLLGSLASLSLTLTVTNAAIPLPPAVHGVLRSEFVAPFAVGTARPRENVAERGCFKVGGVDALADTAGLRHAVVGWDRSVEMCVGPPMSPSLSISGKDRVSISVSSSEPEVATAFIVFDLGAESLDRQNGTTTNGAALLPRPRTFPALTTPRGRRDVGVVGSELVSLRAVGAASVYGSRGVTPQGVLALRNGFKVGGVHTRRPATKVVYRQPIGDRANRRLVDPAVRESVPDASVSASISGPDPDVAARLVPADALVKLRQCRFSHKGMLAVQQGRRNG